jgi:hypothetical protein
LKHGATGEQLIARAEDLRIVLDEVMRRQVNSDPFFFSRIDMTRIAITRHSFGAVTTMALAGQRYPGTSRTPGDPRFKVFIAFGPQVLQVRDNSPSVFFGDLTRPLCPGKPSIEKSLTHLGLEARALPRAPARGQMAGGIVARASLSLF